MYNLSVLANRALSVPIYSIYNGTSEPALRIYTY